MQTFKKLNLPRVSSLLSHKSVIRALLLTVTGIVALMGATHFVANRADVTPSNGSPMSHSAQHAANAKPTLATQIGDQVQTASANPVVTVQGNQRVYRGLGVTFSVSAHDTGGHDLPVVLSGNKITIGAMVDGVSYYALIFTRNPGDSFATTIRKQFLSGYSSAQCDVRIVTDLSAEGYPTTFEKAQLYPISLPTACPAPYSSFDTSAFFLMDSNHPNTYVFIQNNQSPIDQSVNGKGWEQTISFY